MHSHCTCEYKMIIFYAINVAQCMNHFFKKSLPYSTTYVKQPLSLRPKMVFQDQLYLNAGQKYCRMFQGEPSAILSTFIKLPFVIKIFVLSIFEWQFFTGFTVFTKWFWFCLFKLMIYIPVNNFSHVWTFPGFTQCGAEYEVSCLKTHYSAQQRSQNAERETTGSRNDPLQLCPFSNGNFS